MPQGGELAHGEQRPGPAPDALGLFAGDQLAAGGGVGDSVRVLRLEKALSAKVVDGQPRGDGVNPGREGVLRIVSVQFAVGSDEGGLQQVLRNPRFFGTEMRTTGLRAGR